MVVVVEMVMVVVVVVEDTHLTHGGNDWRTPQNITTK